MSPEERQLLAGLFDRVKNNPPGAPDKEADEFIAKAMKDSPHAGYVLSQAVLVQEEALKAAAAKIEELQAQVEELEEKADKAQANSGGFLGGIGKSLFGNNEPEPARAASRPGSVPSTRSGISVPPRPGAGDGGSPWSHQRGMQAAPGGMGGGMGGGMPPGGAGQQQAGGGGGFLKGALGAAAGVAGGVLLANAIGGMMGGSNNPLGIGGAKAAESKSDSSKDGDSSKGDEWADDGSSGDDWKADDNSGDDWDDDDSSGDDWGDDDGGDSWDE
ncbi:MAG: DUF2076 domain-containing protein [Beijerinckiaceae bacterium]